MVYRVYLNAPQIRITGVPILSSKSQGHLEKKRISRVYNVYLRAADHPPAGVLRRVGRL